MRKRAPRKVLSGLVAGAVALGLAPAASAAPWLTVTKNCDGYPPTSAVDVEVNGLPPFEQFTASLDWYENGSLVDGLGPDTFTTDANGSYRFGTGNPTAFTYIAKISWAGGSEQVGQRIDCSAGLLDADAGWDRTVPSGADVWLFGSTWSSDPDGGPLTYRWTQTGGPNVTLNVDGDDPRRVDFTAPTGPATLSFQLEVCDGSAPPLCDTDTVLVHVDPPAPDRADYGARVIVNNPTWAGDGHRRRRGFVVKVRNEEWNGVSAGPFTVTPDDVAAAVEVNGSRAGRVSFVRSQVTRPGRVVKFHYAWRYKDVVAGDDVEYSGCVDSPSGYRSCDTFTTTAEVKPGA